MNTINLDTMSKAEIAQFFMDQSTRETSKLLFEIYVRFVTDQLDADYLQEMGERFGVDLERSFIEYATTSNEEDEND